MWAPSQPYHQFGGATHTSGMAHEQVAPYLLAGFIDGQLLVPVCLFQPQRVRANCWPWALQTLSGCATRAGQGRHNRGQMVGIFMNAPDKVGRILAGCGNLTRAARC